MTDNSAVWPLLPGPLFLIAKAIARRCVKLALVDFRARTPIT